MKTCRLLEHGIYFKQLPDGSLTIKHCCNMDSIPEEQQPHLKEKYFGEENLNFDELFAEKRKDRDKFRRGEYYPICLNCCELKEQEIDEEDYISHVTLAHITKCNSRCVYCYIGLDEKMHNAPQRYRLYPIILNMKEKGILKFTGSLRFMGGEPTLLQDFEEITKLFVDNNIPEIYLPTSGIKFSKAMLEACKKTDICQIFISIDSGSEETYKKIKGVNAYKICLDSLKKYAEPRIMKEHIISKYIIVLGINDNTEEINKWIMESKNIGLTTLAIDIELLLATKAENEKYLKYLYQLFNYAKNQMNLAGLNIDPWLPYIQILQNWAKNNTEKLKNDTTKEVVNIDISKTNIQETEKYLNEIIDKNTIWKKPQIRLISNTEITENKNFNEILYLCYKYGFKVLLSTDANKYSKQIIEALKIANIEVETTLNGKYYNEYKSIAPDKVIGI